eukprot:12572596-Alexandrium_andersonii.AAC.1
MCRTTASVRSEMMTGSIRARSIRVCNAMEECRRVGKKGDIHQGRQGGKQTDRQTDGQMDGKTDRKTD